MSYAKAAGKALLRAIPGYYPATLGGHRFRCDADHAGFWRQASRGRWEPQTTRILTRLLSPGMVHYDVGSWIGPTALPASRLCREVVCFEPDALAFEYLLQNLRLNGCQNVQAFNIALTSEDGLVTMESRKGRLGTSFSFTSTLRSGAVKNTTTAVSMTWPRWLDLARPAKVDVVKMDIEGGEFSLLPTMHGFLVEHKPTLYLSTHAPYLAAEKRHEAMMAVSAVAQAYRFCYDDALVQIDAGRLLEPVALEEQQTFLFSDTPV